MSVSLDKPILCPIMVGRASNLDLLKQRLDQAQSGHGQIFLLAGEAGIGKSRLVAETKAWGQQNGLVILQGNCFEPDRVLPYGPVLDLLRAHVTSHSAEALSAFISELLKLLPELAVQFPGASATPALEPEQEKRRLFQAITEFFSSPNLSPLAIIIEDLHWCDDTSLEFLLSFARRLSLLPIM